MTDADEFALFDLARRVIFAGLDGGRRTAPEPLSGLPAALRSRAGAFVTLTRAGALRGCIGTLEPRLALAHSVAAAAFDAAFRDPRFGPLAAGEAAGVGLEISIIGPLEPLDFDSEADLSAGLVPHRDGLLIEQEGRRATFLPQVWESMASAAQFVAELKRKAELDAATPLAHARAWRYRTEVLRGELDCAGLQSQPY